jgi:4-hydroxy-3-polyprenylbenzoate decarboxylase
MVDHSLGRVLDLFGIDSGRVKRWGQASRRRGRSPTR